MKKIILFLVALLIAIPSFAQEDQGRFEKWRETRAHRAAGKEALRAAPDPALVMDSFGRRDILLHIAPNVPAAGNRAMIIVLHGGMGNAVHIQSTIGADLETAADEGGFVVAYLNGSRASRALDEKSRAWNAGGGCCGMPSKTNLDDIAYITGAVKYLAVKYGVDPRKIFGMGHSNGAIMTQRLMCETDLYQAAIPISGPLNIDVASCPPARGKKILAIHGTLDENVPIGGGNGEKGVTNIVYKSEEYGKRVFEASGTAYTIDAVENTDHNLDHIAAAIERREGRTLGRYAALFFGLAPK